MSMRHKVAGVAKIGEHGDIGLPETMLQALGWKDGDSLVVEIVDGDHVILSRQSRDIVERSAGALTHLFPEPGDVQRFLDEERAAWGDFDRRFDD